jgi:O-antigen/teichoic acid export membrane protein
VSLFRKAFQLLTGTLLAQVVTLLSLPIITRNTSPAEYGKFTIILFVVATLLPLSTLRIETLSISVEDENSVRNLNIFAIINSTLISLLIIPTGLLIAYLLKITIITESKMAYLMCATLLIQSFAIIINQLNIRDKKYTRVMQGSILQNSTSSSLQILATFLNPVYTLLTLAYNFGRAVIILRDYKVLKNILTKKMNKLEIIQTVLRFKSQIAILTIGTFVETLFFSFLNIFIGVKYGPVAAGYLGLTLVLFLVPSTLISSSFSTVIFSEFDPRIRPTTRVRTLMIAVLAMAAGLAVFINVFFPEISNLYLSKKWVQSGEIIKMLAIPISINILWVTSSNLYFKLNKYKEYIFFNCTRAIVAGCSAVIGYSMDKNWQDLVELYFVSSSVILIIPITRIYLTVLFKRIEITQINF